MHDKIICYCSNVTEQQIIDAVHAGARTLKDIQRMTSACTVGNCKEMNPSGR